MEARFIARSILEWTKESGIVIVSCENMRTTRTFVIALTTQPLLKNMHEKHNYGRMKKYSARIMFYAM
jgi:hypothetical protein